MNEAAATITIPTFTCDVTLIRGSNTIDVVATDNAGNTNNVGLTINFKWNDYPPSGEEFRELMKNAANSIDRYSLGSQNTLTEAADGSITIFIQRDEPTDADQVSNWLPSTQNTDPFYLMFRAYIPDSSMYTPDTRPDYVLPELKRVL